MTSSFTLFRVIAAISLLGPLFCLAQDQAPDFEPLLTSFQVAGSTATYPSSINDAMIVTGYYVDKSGKSSGFVRYKDGGIATFNVPGSFSTVPVSINKGGYITGYYEVPSSVFSFLPEIPEGFLRSPDGSITTFGNPASPAINSSFWAQPVAINDSGEIVGNYPEVDLNSVAFIRSKAGAVEAFALGEGDSTAVTGLNENGSIIGYRKNDDQNPTQGFLWYGGSTLPAVYDGYVQINFPGSLGTFPASINAYETIVGSYNTAGGSYDFVRSPDGAFTTLSVPGTAAGCAMGVSPCSVSYNLAPQPLSINDVGTITGSYTSAAGVFGFVRLENGATSTFTYPGSKLTVPSSLNNSDTIVGYYSSGSQIFGFLRLPGD
jgi:hypothetical protein